MDAEQGTKQTAGAAAGAPGIGTIAGVGVGLVAVVTAGVFYFLSDPAPSARAPIATPIATAPPAPASDGANVAAPPAPVVEEAAPVVVPVDPPRFDVVRIAADGAALVAGTAAPGAAVAVLLDQVEQVVTAVDAAGAFAALFQIAPSSVGRSLMLEMRLADGRRVLSRETVLVAPTPVPAPDVAPVAVADAVTGPGPAPDPAAPGVAEAGDAVLAPPGIASALVPVTPPAEQPTSPAPDVAQADTTVPAEALVPPTPAPPTPVGDASVAAPAPTDALTATTSAPDAPAAPAVTSGPVVDIPAPPPTSLAEAGAMTPPAAPVAPVAVGGADPTAAVTQPPPPTALLVMETGVRVIQSGAPPQPALMRDVLIETISYAPEGGVILGGRGVAGEVVRLYLDNSPLLETTIAADGTWVGALPEIDKGVYTLRADQVGADGRVTSRNETPFQREDPVSLAAAGATGPVSITVQPGYTLWRIARENYGDGVLYVKVFEANRRQIRNPDLIYPGQVFAVPKIE